jgi:hypothetical protein
MISETRREPSRRNGCCSRGPTTSEGKASSSRNAVRHGPSRPAGLDPILAGRGVAALARHRRAGRRDAAVLRGPVGCTQKTIFPVFRERSQFPQTKPIGGKLVKTTFEDEQGELKREQRLIMRLFGHTSWDDFSWLGIRRVAVASPRSRRTNPTQRSPVCTISARRTQAAAAMPESRRVKRHPELTLWRHEELTRGWLTTRTPVGPPRASLWPNGPEPG